MSWQQYVTRHKAGRSQVDLADLVEVSQTAVSRWLKGSQGVDAAVAIRFARAVGDEPLTALVEAGYLTPEEAGATPPGRPDYSQLSNDELLELVRHRMREDGERHDAPPIGEAEGTSATGGNATDGGPADGAGDAIGSGSSRGPQYGDAAVHGRRRRGTGRAKGTARGTSREGE